MLALETVRARWVSTLAWGLGTAAFHLAIGAGYATQVARIPGGAKALGGGLEGAARAMQLVRWPAEQLDTFGGYVTYHNVVLLWLGLGLWGALAGARVARGAEAERSLELLLATGRSRAALLGSRALGFAASVALVCLASGAGLAGATLVAGAPDVLGAFLTSAGAGLGGLACYGLGLALAQLAPTRGLASGVAGAGIVAAYVATNAADLLRLPSWLLWFSPFFHLRGCRSLLAGRPFSVGSAAVLVGMAVAAWLVAAWAFSRRDFNGPLFALKLGVGRRSAPRLHFHSYWLSELGRGRWRLVGWATGSAALGGLLVWLEPEVGRLLSELEPLAAWVAASGGRTLRAQYLSFAADTFAPVVAAFAVTHAGLWAAERSDGRLALMLSQPIATARLVLERAAVLLVGAGVVVVAGLAGMLVGALAVGVSLEALGLVRIGLVSLLLVLAIGGVAAALAWVLRGALAVTLLGTVVGASYLLLAAAPLLDWPAWVARLSFFGAFGHPYSGVPSWQGLVLLSAVAIGGFAASVLASTRAART